MAENPGQVTPHQDPTISFMILDMVSRLLPLSSDLPRFIDRLLIELRELTGARCVVLLKPQINQLSGPFQVLGMNPERRRELCSQPAFMTLAGELFRLPEPLSWSREDQDPALAQALKELDMGLVLGIPLRSADSLIAGILAIGLPSPEPLNWIMATLKPLAGVFSLVFQKANLIADQDRIIAERTRELRASEDRMRQLQKLDSLGVLAGGIAHDFNNILTAILGHNDLAMIDLDDKVALKNHLVAVEQSTRRAADLCRQMLAYSGRGRFEIRALDLSGLTKEMMQMLAVSISRKITLTTHLPQGLASIEADAGQIRQVVLNLIINASEAIGDQAGTISVTTGIRECDREYLAKSWLDEGLPAGRYVFLEVADSGCGMSQEMLAQIFDPFFSTKFTGRGLGLPAVLGIVRGHKGTIFVTSETGKGSVFCALFPAAEGITGDFPDHLLIAEGWKGTGTILLVDDEESIRTLAGQMLIRMGFQVVTAIHGYDALDVYRAHRSEIRCVILDLTMPKLDGYETFQEFVRLDETLPIIFSSGYNEQEVVSRFKTKVPAGFLQKPYKMQKLAETVRRVLAKR